MGKDKLGNVDVVMDEGGDRVGSGTQSKQKGERGELSEAEAVGSVGAGGPCRAGR